MTQRDAQADAGEGRGGDDVDRDVLRADAAPEDGQGQGAGAEADVAAATVEVPALRGAVEQDERARQGQGGEGETLREALGDQVVVGALGPGGGGPEDRDQADERAGESDVGGAAEFDFVGGEAGDDEATDAVAAAEGRERVGVVGERVARRAAPGHVRYVQQGTRGKGSHVRTIRLAEWACAGRWAGEWGNMGRFLARM